MTFSEFTVSHGNSKFTIPGLGFGVGTAWKPTATDADLPVSRQLVDAVKLALSSGFKLVDSAEAYRNDRDLGIAIKESNIPRSEIFVTTKVSSSFEKAEELIQNQLEDMQLDYVDLYLIHSPSFIGKPDKPSLEEAWKMLERMYDKGQAKAIGVSNFPLHALKELVESARIKPAVNQVEFHPYVYSGSHDLVKYCEENGILLQSYSPSVPIVKRPDGPLKPVLENLSKSLTQKLGRPINPTQILLRWTLQKGVPLVTTTSKEFRMHEILDVDNFSMTDEEIASIDETVKNYFYRQHQWAKYPDDPPQSQ